MEFTKKHILAGVAAGAVIVAAAGAAIAQRGGDGPHHGGMHHRMGQGLGMMGFPGMGPGPMNRFCRGDSAEMADHLIVRVEHRVKPTDAQKQAFEDFKTAVRTAAQKMEAGCPKKDAAAPTDDDAPKKTPVERLAEAQTGLEASLEALKTFRPAAEKFYATLDDAQKAKLNERPRWRDGDDKHKGDGGKGGDGKDDGAKPDKPDRG